MTNEMSVLQAYLGSQRRHVLGILDGLDDDQLRRPVLPSGWSCLSLVRHLALDVERLWFSAVVAADPAAVEAVTSETVDGWHLPDDATADSVLGLYRDLAARSDEVLATAAPDAPPGWWPDWFGEWRLDDIRQVVLHVIVETAVHAGHLDAARELIDGHQRLVLG